jgi:hypothetical protein
MLVLKGPWTGPLNWDLYATHIGETRIPFHLHVQLKETHQPAGDFPQFIHLPLELQLDIFRFCDSTTLFQLMRVSSATRKEAKKLFWSDPEPWYHIYGDWLLAGGYSGHTLNSIDALACMNQIEVDFGGTEPLFCNAWVDGVQQYAKGPPDDVKDQQIQNFWQILQRRFPCATDVVLSSIISGSAGDLAPAGLTIVAEKCPAGIRTFVSCLQREAEYPRRQHRILWRQVHPSNDRPAAWEVLHPSWSRQSVFPPPKDFRGPVGAFCRMQHRLLQPSFQRWGGQLLLIYAIEGYHLQEGNTPYTCPAFGCGLQFELPGQWALHAVDTGHNADSVPPSKELRALFKKRAAKIADVEQQYKDGMTSLLIDWGDEGSEQRRDAESAFLSQLEHDASYTHDKPPTECAIWLRFTWQMKTHFWLG